jgi:hypothetical protein
MYFKDNRVWKYTGELDVTSLLEFLSGDNYLDYPILIENLQEFTLEVTG